MQCKRCGSSNVELINMSLCFRIFLCILGLSLISTFNLIFTFIGVGAIGASFSSQKTVKCNDCNTKY